MEQSIVLFLFLWVKVELVYYTEWKKYDGILYKVECGWSILYYFSGVKWSRVEKSFTDKVETFRFLIWKKFSNIESFVEKCVKMRKNIEKIWKNDGVFLKK